MSRHSDLFDASAILALIGSERGTDQLRRILPGGFISPVNFAEVLKKLIGRGMPPPLQGERWPVYT